MEGFQEEFSLGECLDVLTAAGLRTGDVKKRHLVHADGDYHRAVHVWLFVESTQELVLQKRADCKDSWPGLWDISSAGHISAGDTSLLTARRELQEELGITLPADAFEFLFDYLQECVINGGKYINNEYNDVYLVTLVDHIPVEAFTLQETEVSAVKYMKWQDYEDAVRKEDSSYVPCDVDGGYSALFSALRRRYEVDTSAKLEELQMHINRYVPVEIHGETTGLSKGDLLALSDTIRAAKLLDRIFLEQEWATNPALKDSLQAASGKSELDRLKFAYYLINKSPWSILDENDAFLTTADSAIQIAEGAVDESVTWGGKVRYRAAFPVEKAPGANFYPVDMDKEEFQAWKDGLDKGQQADATSFFTTIRRSGDIHDADGAKVHDLKIVPYSKEYATILKEASYLLHKAGDSAENPSLKRLLKAKADAFLSNDYYESDIAWMELDSPLDVTIGPYETYEDGLFGYKATFEAFIGIRDDEATQRLKLFSHNLQEMEDNLPMDDEYKSKTVTFSPIRVIQLLYNSGDVKGPQTVAFNLPNDDRIVKERGTAMVMLKNISQAKFDYILLPIANVCVEASQRGAVDFDSFFTHTICHECCHGIGPHNIVTPDGRASTVRLELQEVYSAIEEAKADIVGLWALHFLVDKGLLPRSLENTMYVSFLAGCFRSIRFGLEEAHGKGQALQFNFILEKGGFSYHPDGTFSVDYTKVRQCVEDLSRLILTIEAKGDKAGAEALLAKYAALTPQLQQSFDALQDVQVPVDIFPTFKLLDDIKL
uniref:Nudix hydrolase domain-containing protein n=3 Tax=Physcomitrium patens TaxID=3218 RepID=A9TLP4_PHYPA|nr:nudix hydrolase 3-like [Physcomitrium patens]PNR53362.1 hypothetical protein PHYPA_007037 [Physcomitrium patens]|eukprot:XP_024376311.1 nudix hydrolase 3-like [Physcomitrella patens]